MPQKFTSLEEAANLLGVSKDRLNQLREAGALRAYRDGASWKFRAEDMEKLVADGLPTLEPEPSGLTLGLDDESPAAPASGLELDLADEGPTDETTSSGPPSDVNLEDIDEPTVAADAEEESDVLAVEDEAIDLASDSILLSEAELGSASSRPPSTIIGKADLDLASDLDLTGADDKGSDVKLAPGSDILSAAPDDEVDLELESSPSASFAGLQELEIDLEAESSRILSPDDVKKAKGAGASKAASASSDLELAPTGSDPGGGTSHVNVGGESAVGSGLTGLSSLELEGEDEQVLGGEGSDVTLSGESSGINIISPSDSGLALDEVALDLAGSSPIGSSLDLGEIAEREVDLEPAESKVGDEFQLTPIGEEAEEDKDSSQVIAIEEVVEEEEAGAPISGFGEAQIVGEDFAALGMAPGAVVVSDATETPFSTWNVVLLGCCLFLLAGCGMMVYDLLRNIWSWNDVTSPSSFLLEALNPFL